ncbi:pyridoxamine 5'-phosphate oxidase [Paraoerskovia sediminicola]|uniref:Pyridoxamine 5'-phosphate oxidase n=1 Tax=Paraoerskovia sediminicola TaxID=1138587 RepID=A0ABM8G0C1_9CELL|nr:pyridoxamine 5'-phosphate oxidase family protein [Paraoerskovia sediminicola]BDZ41444.1 pyridoxamine 5'-phosphate oxidase [Paraoerskovia sediminicola]
MDGTKAVDSRSTGRHSLAYGESEAGTGFRALTEDESYALVATQEIGRLAVSAAGFVDIFPVNFALDGKAVVLRTAEGSKLLEITINERVAFECDAWDEQTARSVVIKGRARRLDRDEDIEHAATLGLHPWSSTPKTIWIRIEPEHVTGRELLR